MTDERGDFRRKSSWSHWETVPTHICQDEMFRTRKPSFRTTGDSEDIRKYFSYVPFMFKAFRLHRPIRRLDYLCSWTQFHNRSLVRYPYMLCISPVLTGLLLHLHRLPSPKMGSQKFITTTCPTSTGRRFQDMLLELSFPLSKHMFPIYVALFSTSCTHMHLLHAVYESDLIILRYLPNSWLRSLSRNALVPFHYILQHSPETKEGVKFQCNIN
jgi:hypothetical protein